MTTPTEIVRDFYARLAVGDAPGALALMAADIEWKTMWHYKVDGLGPEKVAQGLFEPLTAEWSTFALEARTFITEGETVVSLGRFTGKHATSGKPVDAAYAHHWEIRRGRIQRFRQYIDTLAIEKARS